MKVHYIREQWVALVGSTYKDDFCIAYEDIVQNMGGCAGKQEVANPAAESPYQNTVIPEKKPPEEVVDKPTNYDIPQLKPKPSSGTSTKTL